MSKSNKLKKSRRYKSSLKKKNGGKNIRLSVSRSNNNIYVQVIDDEKSITLASASTLDKELRSKCPKKLNKKSAEIVGAEIARRAKKAGITDVYFDRGGYLYHGKIEALAQSARDNGLDF